MIEIKHFGHPGHFCGANDCRFHLTTQVGPYLVSTVGDYYPWDATERYEIGFGRYFETMVFRIQGPVCSNPKCNCGMPGINPTELSIRGYKTAGEANVGHVKVCNEVLAQVECGQQYERQKRTLAIPPYLTQFNRHAHVSLELCTFLAWMVQSIGF